MNEEDTQPAQGAYTTGGAWSFFGWMFLIASIVAFAAAISQDTTITIDVPSSLSFGITQPQLVANASLMHEQMVKFIAGAVLMVCSVLSFAVASIKAAIISIRA